LDGVHGGGAQHAAPEGWGKAFAIDSAATPANLAAMPSRIWKVRYLRLVRKVHRLMRHRRLRRFEWWRGLRARLLDRTLWQPCRDTVAGGLSIGLFFAMMPMPLQTVAAAALAVRWRVNIPFAVASCFVSNPLTEVFIRASQIRFGRWLREHLDVTIPPIGQFRLPLWAADFIIGFLLAGILLAFVAYPVVYLFSAITPDTLPIRPPKLRRKPRKSES
jgi:uncharacterized protein (DUF2062 family)